MNFTQNKRRLPYLFRSAEGVLSTGVSWCGRYADCLNIDLLNVSHTLFSKTSHELESDIEGLGFEMPLQLDISINLIINFHTNVRES